MAAFGAKMPSAVEAEGKTLSPDLKKAAADDTRKQSDQAKTGLATPESTPGPDTDRLEADKARQHAEAAKASSKEATSEKISDQAATKAGKRKDRAGKSSETAPSGSSKTSTDKTEEFASNAQGDEDADDGSNAMDLDQSEAPKPDDFRQQIYEKATPYLGKLMENPKDAEATSELNSLNKQIKEQNLKDKLPKKDLENFLIQIPTFVANFEMAKGHFEALKKDPADDKARENLTTINKTLEQLNERHGYPKTWTINVPPKPGADGTGSVAAGSSGAAASKAADKAGAASTKGGVKTKVGVPIPDESDGLTSLGKVVYVRKAGHGSRVIVNRGTDQNPYFEIHPGAAFGIGVAKEWLGDKMYECEDLPKNTTAKQMTIYGRVKVERTTKKRVTKTGRTNSQIQYYLIKVGEEEYVSTRSALSGMKGLSPAKLQRIDAQLDRQNEQLLAELDQCREDNEHPDTGKQLTSADIDEMPWLSPDAMVQNQDEDSDKDEDKDVGDIVAQRAGLKRNSKPKTTSDTPKTTKNPRNSTESEL
ncbi:MAG: hypothetical protein Q9217_004011 [Psora testacea]